MALAQGNQVMLRPVGDSNNGFVLAAWGGDCAGTANTSNCIVTMDAQKNVTATFSNMQPLTVTNTGGGVVRAGLTTNPAGNILNPSIDCGSGCTSQTNTYPFDASVVIQAFPYFPNLVTWGGACSGTGRGVNTCIITRIRGAATVSASFAPPLP
jgi:hypothetical protein